ncbi:MAG: hypothetical protein ACRBCL_13980 [Maritimibacter sp.]
MDLIVNIAADVLLGLGAIGAALYCLVLARRLKRFNNLENGVGGAVAVLSAQVDDMTRTLDQARKAAGHSSDTLTALTERAEDASRKLELMMASLHDLPEAPSKEKPTPPTSAAAAQEDDAEKALDDTWQDAAQEEESAAIPLFSTKRADAKEAS